MPGTKLLEILLKTGKLASLGIGSSLQDVRDELGSNYVEEGEGEAWIRRDYGLIELNLSRYRAATTTSPTGDSFAERRRTAQKQNHFSKNKNSRNQGIWN